MVQRPDDEHFRTVANRLLNGAVVPFLGAGVNLCGRPDQQAWEPGHYLPSGAELATHLANASGVNYPYPDSTDLLRVSQYLDLKLGSGPLYEALHRVFDAHYDLSPVHRLLASLPKMIRAHQSPENLQYPLYVTTNYDRCLEEAFEEAGEPYDLVTYIADGADRQKFRHIRPDGSAKLISAPNTYRDIRFNERPVIAKIHGAVGHGGDGRDSFVVTENHYIAYLSHTDIAKLIPVEVAKRMRKSHFLFLGYSLKDWNLRVILHRLWGEGGLSYNSWSIQPSPESIEERAWMRRGLVELLDARLEDYVSELSRYLPTHQPDQVMSGRS